MAGLFDVLKGGAKKPAANTKPVDGKTTTTPPLGDFADMFKKLQEAQATAAKKPQGLGLDPTKLAEAIGKAQIAPSITAEHIEAIQGGGEAALTALATLMNQTAQASTLQAVLAAQRMVEASNAQVAQNITGDLPQMLKDQMFQQQLLTAMPSLSNPAISPLVETVRAGIAANNPDLSPEQLTEQALKYFQEFTSVVAPQPAAGTDTEEAQETDFFALLDIKPQAAEPSVAEAPTS